MSKAYLVKQMSDGRYWWFEIDLSSEDWNPTRRKRDLLDWCVEMGAHPNEDGWFMLFKFPNGLTATVVWTLQTDGIEVGVRDGDWLVDVIPSLSGEDVVKALRNVMLRSLA